LLGQLEDRHDVVVADFEAGLGTVLRMERPVDVVVVVVQPTVKSLEVGVRAVQAVTERDLGRVTVVANRVRDQHDLARVRQALDGLDPVVVADDDGIGEAERKGVAPFDVEPRPVAVASLTALADRMLSVR
jgi:CO dehydrogenase nickel-insertion accessory protein CooC1